MSASPAPVAGELPSLSGELLRDLEGLNARQRRFVLELFLCNFNSSEAYRRAYGKSGEKNANVFGPRLMADDRVQAILERHRQRTSETPLALTAEEIDGERRRIAKVDPRKLWNEQTGALKKPHELDEDTARAVSGVKVKPDGSIEYRFHSKPEAMRDADKVLGRHVDRVQHELPPNVSINIGVRPPKKPRPAAAPHPPGKKSA